MPKIFISYHRADSMAIAGRIYDRMELFAGDGNVFQDVDDIPFGVDFRTYLQGEIDKCDVVLVIIGPRWLTITDERGQRRLDNPADFVRIEVETALKRGKLVIPVLVDGAEMPNAAEMPEVLRDLCYRNAAQVRHNPDFKYDSERLIRNLERFFNILPSSRSQPRCSQVYDLLPPPFQWINISAGKVTLINTRDDKPEVYLKKNQPCEFTVPAFAIAKYPVTNAQFARFIEANGYNEQKWWTAVGWQARRQEKWMEPRFWQDTDWNGADYPVVGVSWYEALAFCLWLSATSGDKILLPTEQQWQRAAQGDDGRAYPWGNDWDGNQCNNSVEPANSNRTTPVTQYAGPGNSPFDVADLAGNVWEWGLNEYYSGKADLEGTNVRVLRGGSWLDISANYFRADYRGWGSFSYGSQNIGFRFARSSLATRPPDG